MIYPKDIAENIKFRAELIQLCEKDRQAAAEAKYLFENDILFAFNVFFYTYDPRTKQKDLPFVTFPFQDRTILEVNKQIEDGENIFIDKSRDMGATYIILYVFLWRFLTKRSEEYRIGSRKEDYVDTKGDMDSLFEKIRYALKILPRFLMPRGWDWRKHGDTYMRMINPEKRCAIIGEATNRNFARGGRKSAVLFDEFQEWEDAEQAWSSASDSTRCKIALGTAHGSGNKFAELSRTDEVEKKLHLMWWEHPNKIGVSEKYMGRLRRGTISIKGNPILLNQDQSTAKPGTYVDQHGRLRSEWYDSECRRRTEKDRKENIDCDYLTGGGAYFDTDVCHAKLLACKEPIAVGFLLWKVRPEFDTNGNCINQDDLIAEFVSNGNGNVFIWEHPEDEYEDGYCVSADVAEGLEQGDYSSTSVLKRYVDPLRIVATIHGHPKTFEYADDLAKLAVYYGYAWIAVERNNQGSDVITQIFRVYNKLFFDQVLTRGYPRQTDRIGFSTTPATKPIICGHLSKAIVDNYFIDYDEGFWRETLTFVNDNGKLEAQGKSDGQRCFDDRVMDRAILLWTHEKLPAPSLRKRKVIYAGWRKTWNPESEKSLVRFVV